MIAQPNWFLIFIPLWVLCPPSLVMDKPGDHFEHVLWYNVGEWSPRRVGLPRGRLRSCHDPIVSA